MLQGLGRALAIIEALASREGGATASELIKELRLEKSIVSRILQSLESAGWIRDTGTGTYRLTLKLIAMGLLQVENTDLYTLCYPKLFELSEGTGELVQLALVEDGGLTFVAKAETQARIRIAALLGRQADLHGTASGKVWLASLPEEKALKLALNAELRPITPRTLTTVEQLRSELNKARTNGYAINDEETEAGVRGIAVPIYDQDNRSVIGTIVVVAPKFRMSIERAISFVPLLKRAAEDLRGVNYLRAYDRIPPPPQSNVVQASKRRAHKTG